MDVVDGAGISVQGKDEKKFEYFSEYKLFTKIFYVQIFTSFVITSFFVK